MIAVEEQVLEVRVRVCHDEAGAHYVEAVAASVAFPLATEVTRRSFRASADPIEHDQAAWAAAAEAVEWATAVVRGDAGGQVRALVTAATERRDAGEAVSQ